MHELTLFAINSKTFKLTLHCKTVKTRNPCYLNISASSTGTRHAACTGNRSSSQALSPGLFVT